MLSVDAADALVTAVADGSPATVSHLLAARADPSAAGGADGRTPLHVAVLHERDEIMQQLLDAGAEVDATNSMGSSALHWAAERGLVTSVGLLIQAGARLELKSRFGGSTALHRAAGGGHAEVIRALAAARAPLAARDDAGYTPLHWAAEFGKDVSASALVEAGAPLDVRDGVGLTPHDVAAEHNKTDVMAILEGADGLLNGGCNGHTPSI